MQQPSQSCNSAEVRAGRHVLETNQQAGDALVALARRARRELLLMVRRLTPDPYDREPLLEAMRALALARPDLPIRILAFDPRNASLQAPRLLALAHRLPSRIALRRVGDDFQEQDEELAVADGHGYLHCPYADRLRCFADFAGPREARQLRARFEQLWAHGETDGELRQFHL